MMVEVVLEKAGRVGIYGATMQTPDRLGEELPGRPEKFNGPKAMLWKEYT